MVREIRPINGQLYYCEIDYSTNRRGDIVKVNKRICVPINNDTQSEIKDGKIVNIEKGLVEKIEETEKLVDEEQKDENEVIEEENMADANYEIRRQIMDDIAQKQRTEKLEQELADTKAYVSSFDKTIDAKTSELGSKIDRLAMSTQRPREEKVDDILAKIKAKQGLTEHIHSKDDVDCPGCAKGGNHHNLKTTDKGTLKCTGDHCGKEYLLVDKDFDAHCKDCGMLLNSKTSKNEKCVNCGGTRGEMLK